MTFRSTTAARLLGISLLALVLSPLTAPFSTLDLRDLFGDVAPQGATVLQTKTAPKGPLQDPTSDVAACAAAAAGVASGGGQAARAQARTTTGLALQKLPLRI